MEEFLFQKGLDVHVTRGEYMPKRNIETKKHPTYETTVRIRDAENAWNEHAITYFFNSSFICVTFRQPFCYCEHGTNNSIFYLVSKRDK